jgi:hypothetical protein
MLWGLTLIKGEGRKQDWTLGEIKLGGSISRVSAGPSIRRWNDMLETYLLEESNAGLYHSTLER